MLRPSLNRIFDKYGKAFSSSRRFRRNRRKHQRHQLSPIATVESLEDRTLLSTMPLDLTTAGASGSINGAFFQQINPQSTGTGVIQSFVRIQANGMEQGYNTDARPIETGFDTKVGAFTHSINLNNVPKVKLDDGNFYRQFLLDINEKLPAKLLSLDSLQVSTASVGNLTGYTADGTYNSQATLVYDLDGAGDDWIKLDYSLNHGSGSGDMFAYIPDSLFPTGNPFVYLYSKFGDHNSSDAGFEEWSVLKGNMNGKTVFDINGTKFEDLNGDGDITGDPVIEGWEISLYQETDGTAGLSAGDEFIASTTTGTDGSYSFQDIDPMAKGDVNTFYVVEDHPTGWLQTYGGNTTGDSSNDYYTVLLNNDLFFLDFGNFELIDLSGTKFEDVNGDGSIAGDPALTDTPFTINLYEWTDTGDGIVDVGELVQVDSTETDGSGNYSFNDLGPLADGTKYYVQEEGEAGWTQTYGTAGYVVDATSGNDQTGLDFGNFQNITVSGYKWSDCNADGVWDAGEPGIAGWQIFLDTDGDGIADVTAVTSDGTTDANHDGVTDAQDLGYYEFTDLGPGTYSVFEDMPSNSVNTYDGSLTFTAMSGQNPTGHFETTEALNFGNVILGAGGGLTPGFWSNNNGFAAMNDGGTVEPELALLRAANLKNNDGSDFDPTTYTELEDYLVGPDSTNAVNMAGQLSRQLAAMILNVEAGFVDGNALIYAPGVGNTGVGNNFITINDLITAANTELALHPTAFSGDAWRMYQENLKDALDAANNNLNFVQC